MKLFGEYNRNGYTIYDQENREGDSVYQAGNCMFDSGQYLPVGSEGTLDTVTIADFCDSTGEELAKENNCVWLGCQQVDDFERD